MRVLILPLFLALLTVPARAQQEVVIGGASLSLPEDWIGPIQSDESRAPAWAAYELTNMNEFSGLNSAQLVICRITGLDPRERNQWWRGRLSFGYGGMRPISAAAPSDAVFEQARGYRTAGNDREGVIYFTQHGQAYYAVHISALAEDFERQLPALLRIARTIRFL